MAGGLTELTVPPEDVPLDTGESDLYHRRGAKRINDSIMLLNLTSSSEPENFFNVIFLECVLGD